MDPNHFPEYSSHSCTQVSGLLDVAVADQMPDPDGCKGPASPIVVNGLPLPIWTSGGLESSLEVLLESPECTTATSDFESYQKAQPKTLRIPSENATPVESRMKAVSAPYKSKFSIANLWFLPQCVKLVSEYLPGIMRSGNSQYEVQAAPIKSLAELNEAATADSSNDEKQTGEPSESDVPPQQKIPHILVLENLLIWIGSHEIRAIARFGGTTRQTHSALRFFADISGRMESDDRIEKICPLKQFAHGLLHFTAWTRKGRQMYIKLDPDYSQEGKEFWTKYSECEDEDIVSFDIV